MARRWVTRAGETPRDRVRLEQGLNYHLSSRRVGVMNVYADSRQDDAMVVRLAVHDPATSASDGVKVRRGDELTVGPQRYLVVDVANGASDERGWVELEPVRRRRWLRRRR